MLKPRYVMIGGFLGAGKTTAVLQLARQLNERGLRVGLITNDQSSGLVDTRLLNSHGHATEEIEGGCFCCKFNSLIEAAERLSIDQRPEVFIAEPVGSCTDLRSTVIYPLQQLYANDYTLAPMSVLVDPIRAQRVLGLRAGKQFTSKVIYIYEKQLEEADWVVINKTDLLSSAELDELEGAIRRRWPASEVMRLGARSGDGVTPWLDKLMSTDLQGRPTIEVDYDRYAEGEALLGWLNLTANLQGIAWDGNSCLLDLAAQLQEKLMAAEVEIAHLKMTLMPDEGPDLAVVNLVRDSRPAEMAYRLTAPLDAGELILNLRAEASPEVLERAVIEVVSRVEEAFGITAHVEQLSAFSPGRPVPVHRFSN